MMKKKAMVKKTMVKKAQNGKMTPMQKLKKMYPDADTTAAGDTRFEEYNAYAPKKFLDRVNATDKAFDAKYGKGKPAVDKPKVVKKKKAMTGMKMKKMQTGGGSSSFNPPAKPAIKSASTASNTVSSSPSSSSKTKMTGVTEEGPFSRIPAAGAARTSKKKERSADGNYAKISKTRETPAGTKTVNKTRRTIQGILRGAPRVPTYKKGGSVGKPKIKMGGTPKTLKKK
jgi:hypothetical protein